MPKKETELLHRPITCTNCGEPGSRFLTPEEIEQHNLDPKGIYSINRTLRKYDLVYICDPCLGRGKPTIKRLR